MAAEKFKCRRCDSEQPIENQFCTECGTELKCSVCQERQQPGQDFCRNGHWLYTAQNTTPSV